MPGDIVIAGCQLEIDLDKKKLPTLECYVDRERTTNPRLLEGMTCETEFRVFKWDRKEFHRWEKVCRPEPKIFRKLLHAPSSRVIEELKECMKRGKPGPKTDPKPKPKPAPKPAPTPKPAPAPKPQPKPAPPALPQPGPVPPSPPPPKVIYFSDKDVIST